MSDADASRSSSLRAASGGDIEYRAVSTLAVGGLVAGLISAVAFLRFEFWIVPLLAAAVNLVALRRISYYAPSLAGRTFALVGLALAVAMGTAAPGVEYVHRLRIRHEAQLFAEQWFAFWKAGEVHKANHLAVLPHLRKPLDDTLWLYYRGDKALRDRLEADLKNPLIRALVTLDDRATVRHYQTRGQERNSESDTIIDDYVISYEEDGRLKSYFMYVVLYRAKGPGMDAPAWNVVDFGGGKPPKSWPGERPPEPADDAAAAGGGSESHDRRG